MPRFNADVQKPTPKEEAPMTTTASTITPISKTQTAAATADRQRHHRRQRQEPYRTARGRTLRLAHRLPRRDESIP
jgi:hypothetical protein